MTEAADPRPVTFRADAETRARLAAAAERFEGGISGVIRTALESYLNPEATLPPIVVDDVAVSSAAAALDQAQAVAVATRKTVDDLHSQVNALRERRDRALDDRRRHAFGAKVDQDPSAVAELERLSEDLRRLDLEISDFAEAISTSERQAAKAAADVKAASRGLIDARAKAIMAQILQVDRRIDEAFGDAVAALRQREGLIEQLRKSGVDMSSVPISRLGSRARVTRAAAASGLGSFAELDAPRHARFPTLTQSDQAVLSAVRSPHSTEAA